jgi:long-subunit fatty acid transport protein
MSSLAYNIFIGLIGLGLVGSLYSILDQVNMGNIYDVAVQMNLSGDYINIFTWMWSMVVVTLTLAFLVGLYVTAHRSRNEG